MLKKFLITSAAGLLLAACQQQAASPPPAAPLPQAYTVYFDTGQSALSPEATATVAQAAAAFKQGGTAVGVRGHTDTVGQPGVQPAALPAARGRREERAAAQRRAGGGDPDGRRRASKTCRSPPPTKSPSGATAASTSPSRAQARGAHERHGLLPGVDGFLAANQHGFAGSGTCPRCHGRVHSGSAGQRDSGSREGVDQLAGSAALARPGAQLARLNSNSWGGRSQGPAPVFVRHLG